MGYMSTSSFIILGPCGLHHIIGLYHNLWPGPNFCNFFIGKKINMLLYDLSWIEVIMQSLTLYLVDTLVELNNKKTFEN